MALKHDISFGDGIRFHCLVWQKMTWGPCVCCNRGHNKGARLTHSLTTSGHTSRWAVNPPSGKCPNCKSVFVKIKKTFQVEGDRSSTKGFLENIYEDMEICYNDLISFYPHLHFTGKDWIQKGQCFPVYREEFPDPLHFVSCGSAIKSCQALWVSWLNRKH